MAATTASHTRRLTRRVGATGGAEPSAAGSVVIGVTARTPGRACD